MQYTDEQLAETVIRILDARGIEPDDEYTAAAGTDHGHVAVWALPWYPGAHGADRYAVRWGNNAETCYTVGDDTDIGDLAAWLLPNVDDLDDDERPVAIANIRGIDAIEEAPAGSRAPCRILIASDYYGPRTETDWARDERGEILEWPCAADAQEWIDDAESAPYTLAHNESASPKLRIVVA